MADKAMHVLTRNVLRTNEKTESCIQDDDGTRVDQGSTTRDEWVTDRNQNLAGLVRETAHFPVSVH